MRCRLSQLPPAKDGGARGLAARGPAGFDDLSPLRRRSLEFVYGVLARGLCTDCGDSDPLVLEFDHVGAKRKNVSWLAWTGYSLETLLKEICACVIRCCNCHIRRTSERAGDHRSQGYIPDAPL